MSSVTNHVVQAAHDAHVTHVAHVFYATHVVHVARLIPYVVHVIKDDSNYQSFGPPFLLAFKELRPSRRPHNVETMKKSKRP